jgi:hypothetical protein
MSKKYLSEREGQVKFFEDLKISDYVELTNNTDGVYKGTLFEFKLTIPDINKVLFQAIKYLSHKRIIGKPIPAQIMLVSLNEEIAYLFESSVYLNEIETIYAGAASKNNQSFSAKSQPEVIDFSKIDGLKSIIDVLGTVKFTKIHINMFCVVGWANSYYEKLHKASKSDFFEELRNPNIFKDYILPWQGDDIDFKYINDLLNPKTLKKELGAFYTPRPYCLKATELVRKAIKRIPKGNDYIILDRCAGTGNLQEFLTDKPVNEMTIRDLDKYIDKNLKIKYLQDKSEIITTFYSSKNFHEITIGELEKHKSSISLHDYLSDNELSHVIVNTYELKEWLVLIARLENKVKLVVPPPEHLNEHSPIVNGGDALSDHFILGSGVGRMFISEQYKEIIDEINSYVKDPKTNIILFENPPYRDNTAIDKQSIKSKDKSYVYKEFVKNGTNQAIHNDVSNLFIWSAWNYYLIKPDDYYVLFSPIKYWKTHNLGERQFVEGYLFNRQYFHATPSAISCILWKNTPQSLNTLNLTAYDIDTNKTPELDDDKIIKLNEISIQKVSKSMNEVYADKRRFDSDKNITVTVENNGLETAKPFKKHAIYNDNIIGHMMIKGFSLGVMTYSLTSLITYTNGLIESHGFYLRDDNYITILPMFVAKLYPQKNWYERDIYFTSADGGDAYLKDKEFLKSCFIFTCLSQSNHCRSIDGTDGNYYQNKLCFDTNTVASQDLLKYKLNGDEQGLIDLFNQILNKAKITKNYNSKYSYGTYQIDQELNTRYKNEINEWIYDYPELNTLITSLKSNLSKYYENYIQPKLFEYELLK